MFVEYRMLNPSTKKINMCLIKVKAMQLKSRQFFFESTWSTEVEV